MPSKKSSPAKKTALARRKPDNPKEPAKRVCGAKLRGKDATCRTTQLMGNGRCRLHGGKTPAGIASPNYKHGRFSRVMPTHLADRFEDIKADPELISNRQSLALVNTLLEERLKSIYEGCPPDAWKLAKDILGQYKTELDWEPEYSEFSGKLMNGPAPRPEKTLEQLSDLLTKGTVSADAFELTAEMIETHRRAVDTEYKLVKDSQSRMDAADAIMAARALADSVKRHVKDPETLRLIQADMSRIISPRADPGA